MSLDLLDGVMGVDHIATSSDFGTIKVSIFFANFTMKTASSQRRFAFILRTFSEPKRSIVENLTKSST